jgi:hypothetical protein
MGGMTAGSVCREGERKEVGGERVENPHLEVGEIQSQLMDPNPHCSLLICSLANESSAKVSRSMESLREVR